MKKRTKVLLRNICVLPIIICIRVPLYILYFIAEFYATLVEDHEHRIPGWDTLPLSDKYQKFVDEFKEKNKQELIAGIKNSVV